MPSSCPPSATCLASTGNTFCTTVDRYGKSNAPRPRSNLFRQVRFSPDGTTVITQNEDHCLRSFILPQDLLDQHDQHLEPYCTFASSSNIQAFAFYPHFDLQNTSSTLVLSASADVPLTLRNVLHYDTVHAHYPFVHSLTEEHRPARSLAFTRDGSHFIAGSDNVLAIFDAARSGEGPMSERKLRSGRRAPQTDPWHLIRKGIASALSVSGEGLLALGTTQSEIALYDHDGLGDCAATFTLEAESGSGVTDLKWSPDGRYLLVAQRQSDVIDVYDIRGTQRKLASMTGRSAKTTQRMGIDVVSTAAGYEVWAGGTDGCVRMWNNPGVKEDTQAADIGLQLHRGGSVCSAIP